MWQKTGPAPQARVLASFKRAVHAVQLTPDNKAVLATDGDELVWVDLESFEVTRRLPLGLSYIHAAAITPDGSQVACSAGSEVKVWQTDEGTCQSLQVERSGIHWSLQFTPDGKRLLSGGRGVMYVWDPATGELQDTISLGSILYVQVIAVSPDGQQVAAVPSAAGQTVYVFRLPSDE